MMFFGMFYLYFVRIVLLNKLKAKQVFFTGEKVCYKGR